MNTVSVSPRPDSENRRAASSSHVSRHDRMIERMRASSMSAPTSCGRKQAVKQVSPLAAGALASNAKNKSIFILVDARPKAEHDALKGLPITTNPPESSRGSLAEDAPKHRLDVLQVVVEIKQLFELGHVQRCRNIGIFLQKRQEIPFPAPDRHRVALHVSIRILARYALLRQRE